MEPSRRSFMMNERKPTDVRRMSAIGTRPDAPNDNGTAASSASSRSHSIDTPDAVHLRFHETQKDQQQTYRCRSCRNTFEADSLIVVMDHYMQPNLREVHASRFHSGCLYCDGRVHEYEVVSGQGETRYYHHCTRRETARVE